MKKIIIFTILTLVLSPNYIYSWQKNVVVSPLRVVMDEKENSFSVKIINPSKTKTTYRISLISMKADEFGRVAEDKNSNEALKIIKFSPKKITLPPNGIQTIRLMARKKADLPPGEYRAHLKVSPLPPPPEKKEIKKSSSINIQLNLLINTTIPVIFRNKASYCSIEVKTAELKNDSCIVALDRQGPSSALVNINIFRAGDNKLIGSRKRVAFYTPNNKLVMPVKIDSQINTGEKVYIQIENAQSRDKFIYDVFSLKI